MAHYHNPYIEFCDLIYELNFRQLVLSPTHRAGNTLDLILTNNDQIIQGIAIHNHLPSGLSSDHFIIFFQTLFTIHLKLHLHVLVLSITQEQTGRR